MLIYQVILIVLYVLTVAVSLVGMDFFVEERAKDYLSGIEDSDSSSALLQRVLLVTELFLLVFIIIELIMHIIAYGLLFIRKLRPILTVIAVLANCALIIAMVSETERRYSLFGVKTLAAVTLLALRGQTIQSNIERL